MKKIKKPWGSEEIIELNKNFVKKILMKKNIDAVFNIIRKNRDYNSLKVIFIFK